MKQTVINNLISNSLSVSLFFNSFVFVRSSVVCQSVCITVPVDMSIIVSQFVCLSVYLYVCQSPSYLPLFYI